MKLFNYAKLYGAFIDGYQLISIPAEPTSRDQKKLLEAAMKLIDSAWQRREAFMQQRSAETGEIFDKEAAKAELYPRSDGKNLLIQLQFLQDVMVKKIAAIQNNTSIHNKEEVQELRDVFDEYGVKLESKLTRLRFDYINWTAKPGQKPKLLVHCFDVNNEPVVIRFEAAGELFHKFLHAILALKFKPGVIFDISVEAVDPAIAHNAKVGFKAKDEGRFVNHNLFVKVGSGTVHTGHPPKGTKFIQKLSLEQCEELFYAASSATKGPLDDI